MESRDVLSRFPYDRKSDRGVCEALLLHWDYVITVGDPYGEREWAMCGLREYFLTDDLSVREKI